MPLKKNKLLIGVIVSIFVGACTSPEADGIKAAKKYANSEHELAELRQKYYAEFIKDFNTYHFQTRIEARRKVQEITDQINAQYNTSLQRADQYYHQVSSRYSSNEKRYNVFQYAYNGYNGTILPADDTNMALMAQIDNLIYTIIPPKHDIQNLPNDLVGRKISEGPNGYRGQNWYWEITSANQVEPLLYQNIENIGNDYKVNAILILHGEYTDYWADVIVYYVLRNYDDWTIDVIEPNIMQILETKKYNNFITVRPWGVGADYYYFDISNSSDVALLVGGVTLLLSGDRWIRFSVVVNAYSKKTIGGWQSKDAIRDLRIHFIERP